MPQSMIDVMTQIADIVENQMDMFLDKDYPRWFYFTLLAGLPDTEENRAFLQGVLKRIKNERRPYEDRDASGRADRDVLEESYTEEWGA